MTKQKMLLAELSMDLKRVALASYSRSFKVAELFIAESLAKKNKIDMTVQRSNIQHSTLLQNAALNP